MGFKRMKILKTNFYLGAQRRRLASRQANSVPIFLASVFILLTGCASQPKPEPPPPLPFPPPPEQARFYFERTIWGTGDVKKRTDDDYLKEILTGIPTRSGTAFAKPFDVAVTKGKVYVSDSVARVVHVLDYPAGHTYTIGDKDGGGTLYKPLGLALDNSGNLYVSDITAKKIQIYDNAGTHLRTLDGKEKWSRPSGIDVSPDGSTIFIVDTGGVESDAHRVLVVDAYSGELKQTIGKRGTKNGELNLPRDVHLGPDGLLYVTDGGNFRVQVFTQEGEFVRTWGKPGRRLGHFSRPKGITVDGAGNIYASDAAFGNFQIFNSQGQLLLFIGARSTKPGPAQYMLPSGIDVDEDGRIFFVDQFFRKVDVFRPATLRAGDGYLAATNDNGSQ